MYSSGDGLNPRAGSRWLLLVGIGVLPVATTFDAASATGQWTDGFADLSSVSALQGVTFTPGSIILGP